MNSMGITATWESNHWVSTLGRGTVHARHQSAAYFSHDDNGCLLFQPYRETTEQD
jgi:hypothetical protein